jgi:hypothetical protein
MALGEQHQSALDAAHLAQCPDCRLELDRLTRVVELGREGPVSLEQPPAVVWERIAAAVGQDQTAPPEGALLAVSPPENDRAGANGSGRGNHITSGRGVAQRGQVPARRRRVGRAVAGVAAGLIIGIGGTVAVTQLTGTSASQVVAEIALRPLPQFPQWQAATGSAVLRQTTAAQQLTVSVAAPSRPGFYEVWLLGRNGTSMISLGDLNAAHSGTFTVPADVDLRFYSRIDVSLQAFNGSTLHSKISVVRGSLPASATRAAT